MQKIKASYISHHKAKNNTIFWCGNGGSASQANHLSAELIGGMYKDKKSPSKSTKKTYTKKQKGGGWGTPSPTSKGPKKEQFFVNL